MKIILDDLAIGECVCKEEIKLNFSLVGVLGKDFKGGAFEFKPSISLKMKLISLKIENIEFVSVIIVKNGKRGDEIWGNVMILS